MSGSEVPGSVSRPGISKGRNAARTSTIRLPDGEIVELHIGWNELRSGQRAYLRRDGVVTYEDRPNPQASSEPSSEVAQAVSLEGSPRPAWSRPPFTKGHTLSVTHSAHSPRFVEPLVTELVEATVAAAPFLAEPSFASALTAWARAEARCALLATWLDEHGLLDPEGNPRPASALMVKMESLALKQRARMGLDAASRAGIEASLTSSAVSQANLEAVLDRGAEQIRERLARADEVTP